MFRGNLHDAKKARAALLVEVSKGRHTGSRATLDDLFAEWIIELRRKGRSPNTVHGYELVYKRNIQPTLGAMQVTKVTTKTLTDLYGAHQKRGLAARSVYQMHACLSSMFTQACRWGWHDSNPAQWAEPPSIPNTEPTVPTPDEVLHDLIHHSRSEDLRVVEAVQLCDQRQDSMRLTLSRHGDRLTHPVDVAERNGHPFPPCGISVHSTSTSPVPPVPTPRTARTPHPRQPIPDPPTPPNNHRNPSHATHLARMLQPRPRFKATNDGMARPCRKPAFEDAADRLLRRC